MSSTYNLRAIGSRLAMSALTRFRNVPHQRATDHLTELYWNRVADEPAQFGEIDFLLGIDKGVVLRERLEHCRLAERDCPVLGRMAEAPISVSMRLRRDGRRGFVVCHPTVHTRISLPAFLFVAFGDQRLRPVPPRTSWLRRFDPPQIELRQSRRRMQWITPRLPTRRDRAQVPYGLVNGPVSLLRVSRLHQPHGTESRSDDYEPFAPLRNSVLQAVQASSLRDVVSEFFQSIDEPCVDSRLGNPGNILHGDEIGLAFTNKAGKRVEQSPVFAFGTRVRRERLTRRTSSEERRGIIVGKPFSDLACGQRFNVFEVEVRGVVHLEGEAALVVEIDARDDRNTCLGEAVAQPTHPAEQIDPLYRHVALTLVAPWGWQHRRWSAGRGAGYPIRTDDPSLTRQPYDWCRVKESNPRPSHYKCAALPTELTRQTFLVTVTSLRGDC